MKQLLDSRLKFTMMDSCFLFEDSPIVDYKPQFLLFNFDNHFLDLGLFTEINSVAILFTPFKFTAEIASGFILRNSTVLICMSYKAVQIIERL